MPLHCPKPARERILAMGAPGAGKTRLWLTIAKKAEQLRSPGTFYVQDTDMATRRMIGEDEFALLLDRTQFMRWVEPANPSQRGRYEPDGAVIENPRIVVFEPYEWPEYVEAMKICTAKITNDDWLVVDLANPAWDTVQDEYIEHVFKKESLDFYMAHREKNGKGGALDGDKDWSVINRMYRDWSKGIMRCRGHVFLSTGVKGVQTDGARVDAKEVRVTFGAYGVKPEGQKHTWHMVHTIILAAEFKPGEWTMTTIKDREREKMTGKPVKDFVMDYLVPVAGWKLA
jgi:hypothetical protein